MKIHVNLVSKEVYTFDLPVVNPIEILNTIRATEIFKRDVHQFLGKTKTVSINPDYIEWIEFETNEFPTNAPFIKIMTIRQLSPEVFKQRVDSQINAIKAAMELDVAKNILLAYGITTFKSGRSLRFEIQAKIERAADRVKYSQQIFKMPALFIRGETSGLFLVNTKNVAVWQVVPGLKKSTFISIPGDLVGVKKAKLD